uniref:kappa-type opioid receptor isoform X2 n=1 Tax=Gasterosteus aculeatus aculeatus TaxID=481459 RepID=UPI001A98D72A|nr:kappa-type opioid receptor isoform X2 [Gasterosteus aculeatus aculeatus]
MYIRIYAAVCGACDLGRFCWLDPVTSVGSASDVTECGAGLQCAASGTQPSWHRQRVLSSSTHAIIPRNLLVPSGVRISVSGRASRLANGVENFSLRQKEEQPGWEFSTMDSGVVHIYKEDRCPSGQLEDCFQNFTWPTGSSDIFNNTHNGTWDTEPEPMSPIIPIIVAVYSVVFVVGLAGNCLVMFVIVRYTKMKTATNIYIFNLAVADALVTTTMPFQSTDYLLSSWPFGEVVCKVFISIDYYNMFTSILTLTMMSVDRYVAVCHPVKALDFRTPVKAKIVNVIIWVLSSAAGIPAMILGSTKTNNGTTECALQFPDPYSYWDTLMKICVFIFGFVLPVIIISVCYTLMVMRLKSVRLLSGSREKDRNLRRITRLVLVVVAVFVVCWTPIHIFVLVKALYGQVPETTAVMAAYFFCVALGYTNSSLNPILYAFLDENFKRCFRDFCCPGAQGHRDSHGLSRVRSTLRDHSCPPDGRGDARRARNV